MVVARGGVRDELSTGRAPVFRPLPQGTTEFANNSLIVMKGAPLRAVADPLGHRGPRTVMLWLSEIRYAVSRLGSRVGVNARCCVRRVGDHRPRP
jgi:hypothetical protein